MDTSPRCAPSLRREKASFSGLARYMAHRPKFVPIHVAEKHQSDEICESTLVYSGAAPAFFYPAQWRGFGARLMFEFEGTACDEAPV